MKSSTIRRSALSKESMDVIENLANETQTDYSQSSEQNSDYTPSEYYRETDNRSDNKSKEIDLLWQTFKSAQFNTKSPIMHWIGGFILGVIKLLSLKVLLLNGDLDLVLFELLFILYVLKLFNFCFNEFNFTFNIEFSWFNTSNSFFILCSLYIFSFS